MLYIKLLFSKIITCLIFLMLVGVASIIYVALELKEAQIQIES